MEYIKKLSELSKDDVMIAGGKGASLGEMLGAGIAVPDGFVVSADTFDYFLAQTDLTQEVSAIIGRVDVQTIHTVEDASEKIQALIKNARMPKDVGSEIMKAYSELCAEPARNTSPARQPDGSHGGGRSDVGGFVAVRSSATAEDGATHAWAGQLDSFLNVTQDNLLESVQKCWASLFTPRAIFYRFEKGLDTTKISVAVVVQQMVNSEKSGIAFSVHPVTEDPDQMIIEAGFGLGEAIVSGAVTPDSYVVAKSKVKSRRSKVEGAIIDTNINEQTKALYRSEGGDLSFKTSVQEGNEWKELGEKGKEQVLCEKEILELAALVKKIEDHYGFPCDIEWAQEGGKFFITQSRPITTLSKKEEKTLPPLYESDEAIFRWGPIPGQWFYISDFIETTFSGVQKNFGLDQFPQTHILFKEKSVVWLNNETEFRDFCKNVFMRIVDQPETLKKLRRQWTTAVENLKQAQLHVKDDVPDDIDGIYVVCKDFNEAITQFWLPTIPGEFGNYGSEEALRKELFQYIENDREANKAMRILTAPTEPSFFQRADIELSQTKDIKQYASRYFWLGNGYGGVKILDEKYFKKEKKRLSLNLEKKLEIQFEQKRKEKKELIKKYNLSQSIVEMSDLIVKFILEQDERKAHMLELQHYKEELLKKISQKTHISVEELHRVSLDEIVQHIEPVDLKTIIARRSSIFGVRCSGGHVDFLDQKRAKHYWQQYASDKVEGEISMLSGIVASRGSNIRSSGHARIIIDPAKAENFEKGAILVTTMTSPEFIALMRKSGGIVTDTGGLTSHAAIISRELNIPCIVNTKIATQSLHDGDLVELDVHAGIVRKINCKEKVIQKSGIEKVDWVHFIEREHSLNAFTAFFAPNGHMLNKVTGLGVEHQAVLFDCGTGVVLRSKRELKEQSRHLCGLMKNNEPLLQELLSKAYKWNAWAEDFIGAFTSLTEKKKLDRFLEALSGFNNLMTYSVVVPFHCLISLEEMELCKENEATRLRLIELIEPLRMVGWYPKVLDTVFGDYEVLFSKKYKVPVNWIKNLTINELTDAFSKDNFQFPEDIEKRNRCVFWTAGDSVKFSFNVDLYESLLSKTQKKPLGDVIEGQTANKGKAVGTARIVGGIEDMYEVREGDVLVAVTTNPSITPAIKKASAIVTDEGGLVSHAAIIARELKKPCIIGTKIATKVLKDGDLVEVDADEGIVRKIKTKVDFKKDDYILSFWVKGVNVFVTDVHKDAYADLEVLYIIDKGLFKQYFTLEAYERALGDGLNFYSDKDAFSDYKKDLEDHCKKFQMFFDSNIKGKDSISEKDVQQFFDFTVNLCKEYAKMNFEYTDKAFAAQEDDEIIKNNLVVVATFKDNIRAFMNTVLFEDKGYAKEVFMILGNQFSVSPSVLENLTQKELLNLFENVKPDELAVSKRQGAYACTYNQEMPYEGEEVEKIVKEFEEKTSDADQLYGQVASKGKISGAVKIIPVDYSDAKRVNDEIDKMQQGDILVTETTAPELMSACKKAGAIITDMGGLMSHAAIVSRELGIPCIVGTKNATKVLKDWDVVEVDADKGVVKILKKTKKLEYQFIWSNYQTLSTVEININSFTECRDNEWNQTKNMIEISQNNTIRTFHSHADVEAEKVQGKRYLDDAYFSDFIVRLETAVAQLWHTYRSLSKINPKKLSNQKLADWFATVQTNGQNIIGYFRGSQAEGTEALVSALRKLVTQKELSILLRSPELDDIDRETVDWWQVIQKKPTKQMFLDHVHTYPWLTPAHYTYDDVLETLKQRYAYDKKHAHAPTIEPEKKKLAARQAAILKEKPAAKDLVGKLQRLAAVRVEVKAAFTGIDLYLIPVIAEIAKRTKEPVYDINYFYRIADVKALASGGKKLSGKTKKARAHCFVGMIRDSKSYFYEGVQAEKIAKEALGGQFQPQLRKQLTGVVANTGVYTGVVRILPGNNVKAARFMRKDFKKGEILVTQMTQPAIMDIAARAGAIVTDEGGMLSHAAIISRELGIPCVIATDVATQVLADGDHVEVDADNGVVKIVEEEIKKGKVGAIDWEHYLTRPFDLFACSLWYQWYIAPEGKGMFGVKIDKTLFIQEADDVVRSYRSNKQHIKYIKNLDELIVKNPEKYLSLLEKGLKENRKAKEYISAKKEFVDIKSAVNFLVSLALHSTVLPYFVLISINKQKVRNKRIKDLSERLRLVSYYPEFMQKIIIPMAKDILEKSHINDVDRAVKYITYEELLSRDFSSLKDRMGEADGGKSFVFEIIEGVQSIKWISDSFQLIQNIEGENSHDAVRGQTAYGGVVKGRVRIVRSIDGKEFDFDEGDVLVSINSNPHFMHLIKKASAIVTNEGGVACHAAIISRELKKPCIIGTKNATKVLKDGDMVEVDADNGIVRIIS